MSINELFKICTLAEIENVSAMTSPNEHRVLQTSPNEHRVLQREGQLIRGDSVPKRQTALTLEVSGIRCVVVSPSPVSEVIDNANEEDLFHTDYNAVSLGK